LTTVALADVAATERLGEVVAAAIQWGRSGPRVAYLQGELGSGKTTLARGLLRELGVTGTVRSPTYTLVECYESGGHRLLHIDLYRLSAGNELANLGLRDELVPGALLLIEWPERAMQDLPPADLTLRMSLAPGGRIAQLEACSAPGHAWLQGALARLYPESNRV
jgi:tRNA threonylcarbamoyladenosine biosynthesis protein TsaE